MSMDNARRFYEKVKLDKDLQQKIGLAVKENPQGIGTVIMNIAKENGLEFTAEELNTFFAEAAKTNSSGAHLNDNELESVAGGSGSKQHSMIIVNMPTICLENSDYKFSVGESFLPCKMDLPF